MTASPDHTTAPPREAEYQRIAADLAYRDAGTITVRQGHRRGHRRAGGPGTAVPDPGLPSGPGRTTCP